MDLFISYKDILYGFQKKIFINHVSLFTKEVNICLRVRTWQ